jgi:hypothetical protein
MPVDPTQLLAMIADIANAGTFAIAILFKFRIPTIACQRPLCASCGRSSQVSFSNSTRAAVRACGLAQQEEKCAPQNRICWRIRRSLDGRQRRDASCGPLPTNVACIVS